MTLLIRNMPYVWLVALALSAGLTIALTFLAGIVYIAGNEIEMNPVKIFAGFTNMLYWGVLLSGGVMAAMSLIFTVVQIAVLDLHADEATKVAEEGRRYRRLVMILVSIGLAIGSAWLLSFIGEYVGKGGSILRHYFFLVCFMTFVAGFGSFTFWRMVSHFEVSAVPRFAPGR